MAKVLLDGLMEARTMVISTTIILKGWEFTIGAISGSIEVSGKTTRWKEQDFSRGPMAEFMRESIVTTKRKDKEFSHGLMDESMKVNGSTVSKMGLGHTQLTQVKHGWASGGTESELLGSEYL